jgi:hypothetical protein
MRDNDEPRGYTVNSLVVCGRSPEDATNHRRYGRSIKKASPNSHPMHIPPLQLPLMVKFLLESFPDDAAAWVIWLISSSW